MTRCSNAVWDDVQPLSFEYEISKPGFDVIFIGAVWISSEYGHCDFISIWGRSQINVKSRSIMTSHNSGRTHKYAVYSPVVLSSSSKQSHNLIIHIYQHILHVLPCLTTPTPVISPTDLMKRFRISRRRAVSPATRADLLRWMPTSRLVKAFIMWQSIAKTFLKRDIASKGGHASSGSFKPGDERAKEAGRKGGQTTDQPDE